MDYVLKDEDGKEIGKATVRDEVQAAAFEKAGFVKVEEKKK